MNVKYAKEVAHQFQINAPMTDIQLFGCGNINKTYLVNTEQARFILQCINTDVFANPELVMQNMSIITEHIKKAIALTLNSSLTASDNANNDFADSNWQTLTIIQTNTAENYYRAPDNTFWRMISFIENSQSYDTIDNDILAKEVGRALGIFHTLVSTLPITELADTLEGFHITPLYLDYYDEVIRCQMMDSELFGDTQLTDKPDEVNYCKAFIENRRTLATVLEDAKHSGALSLRVMHGDPKVNNIMIDKDTGKSVSMVDLDTVKSGLIHYDIGDCIRSGCNPMGEEAGEQWQSVYFDCDNCRSILTGYLAEAKEFFTDNDYQYLYDAIRLIAFELGLRFFTDYLEGNVYFKSVDYPEHNLHRALVQFKLTESIESHESEIQQIISDMKAN